MLRPPSVHLVLGLGLLALAACGESDSPTQPATESAPVTPPLAALTSNTWTLRAPYPEAAGFGMDIAAGVVNNSAGQPIVYTFGGADEEDCCAIPIARYNVATNTWSVPSREPAVFEFRTNGVGQIGGKLYFSGGYDKSGSEVSITPGTWAYDPVSNALTRKADMPKATANGISAVIDGKLFVLSGTCSIEFIGGVFCDSPFYRRVLRYNPAADHWVSKRLAPHFHRSGAGGAIGGKFYVAGGIDTLGAPVTALDVYDPLTDTWKTLAPLPIGGKNHGAVIQGKLFVIISTFTNEQVTNQAYVYDPTTNRWNPKAAPKLNHDAVVLVRLDDKPYLLAVGGAHVSGGNNVPNDSELYTP
ncbi:MAG: Kelch repeat-containing protein [Gemmatimonadales bacterium]